ncbi:hypothetical protein ISN45_At02g031630 [Arabidopsis thaliana x Arabidopsis arenosa]|uniref:Uncharacterized protein n=2 Tax=Arabidopsis TaxID=3701 RepID=A0A8T2G7F7_ARASU|nr:hypothetical protein ISN45_At02g031630 [Arabidopsis thaliana x Arabidopsis arenosa]KAG7643366.1 hypothetical protein ISN44_As02g031830 [Arabidopsis suecica]
MPAWSMWYPKDPVRIYNQDLITMSKSGSGIVGYYSSLSPTTPIPTTTGLVRLH